MSLLASVGVIVLVGGGSRAVEVAPQEYDKYRSATALNQLWAKMGYGEDVAAFNAGVYDYYTDFDVMNLDGVVNPGARDAIERDRLVEFVEKQGVGFLIEHRLEEAANVELLSEDKGTCLQKVRDLRRYYEPYRRVYEKDTFLWRIRSDGRCRAPA